MEKIFDNKYLTFELDSAKSIFMYTWKPTSENLTAEELISEGQRCLQAVFQHNVRSIISNDVDFRYPMSPELQVEMNKSILSVLNQSKVKKFAHIFSKEFIAQLSVEQFFDENKNKSYEDKYFSNFEDAVEWCNA